MASIDVRVLVGSWQHVAWLRIDAEGRVNYPYTAAAEGRLGYSGKAYTTVLLVDPQPPRSRSDDRFTAYSGRFWVNVNMVEHVVDLAGRPEFDARASHLLQWQREP